MYFGIFRHVGQWVLLSKDSGPCNRMKLTSPSPYRMLPQWCECCCMNPKNKNYSSFYHLRSIEYLPSLVFLGFFINPTLSINIIYIYIYLSLYLSLFLISTIKIYQLPSSNQIWLAGKYTTFWWFSYWNPQSEWIYNCHVWLPVHIFIQYCICNYPEVERAMEHFDLDVWMLGVVPEKPMV